MELAIGLSIGIGFYVVLRCIIFGFYTVAQDQRAVLTSFGKARRIENKTTLDDPVAAFLDEEHRQRYAFPQVRVIKPGGPYFKFPWQKVHKASIAIQTVNIAQDPENPEANQGGTVLDAVTKDQLNIGITGQMRFKVAARNLYAYLFGVKNPIAHVLGYFIAILRERIANFEQPADGAGGDETSPEETALALEGVSINDLRKNLNDLNSQMDQECRSAAARYGLALDASLITGIDPPQEIESALAAINTAHNEVSADVSAAKALADQTIEQSKRAVEKETMRAQAEVQPLVHLATELQQLKQSGPAAIDAFVRNVKLDLYGKAKRVFLKGEAK